MQFITSKRDYLKVYEDNRILKGNLFNFLISNHKRKDTEEPGIGIIVSKKVGKAVVRNLVKRRVKAFLRERNFRTWDSFVDIVIISKPVVSKASWKEIREDLELFFKEMTSSGQIANEIN